MLQANDTGYAREPAREGTDLGREYRPIGIGAVAAALAVTSKKPGNQSQAAANSNERRGTHGSLAA
jgi:hypothetical protein